MTFNIIVKENKDDSFIVPECTVENNIVLPSFQFNHEFSSPVSHDISYWLKKTKLSPSDIIIDFLNLSLSVYSSDQIISRSSYGYYGWSRHIKIHLPVSDVSAWNSEKIRIENILSFLSGDKWKVNFRERARNDSSSLGIRSDIDAVSLLSGGLDSFLGAIELSIDSKKIVFVSHHKKGNSGEMNAQINLVKELKNEYIENVITHFPFYVQPNPRYANFGEEKTQRARSIIFIALGLIVANSYGNDVPLYIPENGLISLNVPLTFSRLGTFSTKTTHPKFLNGLNSVLENLGVNNSLINPFKFLTKGEMISRSRNHDMVENLCKQTISCAKPGYYMRLHGKKECQCGFCTPCIIRQSAIYSANFLDYDSEYVFDVIRNPPSPSDLKGRDLQAFRIGIERMNKTKYHLFNLLTSGDLPGNENDLLNYLGVYERGLGEVNKFLKQI
ncbi:MAG: Qat anti-phage system QueC-like protein QatC [Ignavibacteriaceae bacterium]